MTATARHQNILINLAKKKKKKKKKSLATSLDHLFLSTQNGTNVHKVFNLANDEAERVSANTLCPLTIYEY